MRSSEGKIQRKPDEKVGDIINPKLWFWLRKEKHDTVEIQHVENGMMSAREKIQRKSERKGHDIINFK